MTNKHPFEILSILRTLGLELSISSGGNLKPLDSDAFVERARVFEHFNLVQGDKKISFIDGSLFLKSVETTEKSLKIKLFT